MPQQHQQQVLPLVVTADEEALRLFAYKKKIGVERAKTRMQHSGYIFSEKNGQITISSQPARLVKVLSATAKANRTFFEDCLRAVTPAPTPAPAPVAQPAPAPIPVSATDPSAQDQPSAAVDPEPPNNQLALSQVDVHGMLLHAVKTGENKYEVTISSVCGALGLDSRGQLRKLMKRSWASGRVVQRTTLAPNGSTQADTHMINLEGLMMWLANINENLVDESTRAGLILLQEECTQALHDYFATGAAVNSERFTAGEISAKVDSKIASAVATAVAGVALNVVSEAMVTTLAPFIERVEHRLDELQLQVTQGTQRAVETAVANLRTDFRLETLGVRGRYLQNGTDELYITMSQVTLQLLADPDVQREALQHGCALEGEKAMTAGGNPKVVRLGLSGHISHITKSYVKTSEVIIGLEDVVPLDRNNRPKTIPQQIYNKEDIANIKEGVIAWIRLGFCEWCNREFMVNGQRQIWPYPDIRHARKLLTKRGFTDAQVDDNIKYATAILRFPGVPVQAPVAAGGTV